jgi:type II secretory pathway component PulM
VVDSSLPQHKLVMKRYQPIGEQGAQVWLEDASLPEVIAWLSALEAGSGMRLDNVSIVSSDKQGYVKTRVRLERN